VIEDSIQRKSRMFARKRELDFTSCMQGYAKYHRQRETVELYVSGKSAVENGVKN